MIYHPGHGVSQNRRWIKEVGEIRQIRYRNVGRTRLADRLQATAYQFATHGDPVVVVALLPSCNSMCGRQPKSPARVPDVLGPNSHQTAGSRRLLPSQRKRHHHPLSRLRRTDVRHVA